jgi:hypothetical protein
LTKWKFLCLYKYGFDFTGETKMNNTQNGGTKTGDIALPKEMVFVIIYEKEGGAFFLQQKDSTYRTQPFRHKYNFFGTGITEKETPFSALQRKLKKEMPRAEPIISEKMLFWKNFTLPWGAGIDGEYLAHVYTVKMENRYSLVDLKELAGMGGTKRGSQHVCNTTQTVKMISQEEFMASLHVVAKEFLTLWR